MKPSALLALLFAAVPALTAPTRDDTQVILNMADDDIPTTTRATTTLTAFTTVPTTRTRTTPTPLWMMTKTQTHAHTPTATPAVAQAVWDWLFHPQPPNRSVRPKGEGCFCAGGSTCCYRPDEQIVCGFGTC